MRVGGHIRGPPPPYGHNSPNSSKNASNLVPIWVDGRLDYLIFCVYAMCVGWNGPIKWATSELQLVL